MNYVKPIKDKQKIKEIKNILKKQCYRDYFLFELGVNTGMRISDLLQLQVKDIKNKSFISIKNKKTGKNKQFIINTALKKTVEEYIQGMHDNEYLFAAIRGKEGKPISRVRAYKLLNEAAKKAGLEEIGTHTMRKTFGYHFYKEHKDIALLQELFEHSSPSVTLKYIDVEKEINKSLGNFSL